MKHSIKNFMLFAVAVFLAPEVYAYDFKEVCGGNTIYYSKSENSNALYVTSSGEDNVQYVGDVVIPDSVKIDGTVYVVEGIASSAFKGCSGISTVKLPETLAYIGDDAFRNCVRLTEINFPSGLKKLGYYSFGNTSLKKIKIPAVEKIEGMAFKDCQFLTDVELSDNTKVIEDFAFMNCVKLKNVNLPEKMEILGRSAFFNCYLLGDEVTLSEKVKLVGLYAFGNCHSLKVVRCDGTAYIPYCEQGAFGDVLPINKTLVVPPGTRTGYSRMQVWKEFVTIKEE